MFGRRLHDENIVLNIEKLSEWWQEKNEGFSIDFSETFTRPLRPGKELPWWEFVQKFLSLLRFFSKAPFNFALLKESRNSLVRKCLRLYFCSSCSLLNTKMILPQALKYTQLP